MRENAGLIACSLGASTDLPAAPSICCLYQENIDTTSPLGQALFTIVSAVAQLERDLIRERVSAGLRNARA